ncbi:tetratricopeptide repeat protein 21B-like [Planococcus citri]|uniref:tetratricopeptide repeat protein 21B-like n=1 Tax=Planococcus citri TaxID=170843 RepID=UPI0031F99DF1
MDFALAQYYCREKYYHTMQIIAESALKDIPDDNALKLQYCVALILQNKTGEALRQLEELVSKSDTGLAAVLASIYAQNLCEVPDGEALIMLENRLKNERKRASESALYYAANFLLQINDYAKAREYEDILFRMNRNAPRGFLIKGWLELNDGKFTKAADCFRNILAQDSQNFEAAVGEIQALSKEDAVTRLNQLIVKYSKLTPPLVEKMKLVLTDKDWDQAIDIAVRILSIDTNNIPALQMNILNEVCHKGNYEISRDVENLYHQINIQEPSNWILYYEFGMTLSRTCGAHYDVVKECVKFLQHALRLVPENIQVNLELAYEYQVCGNYQAAAAIYKNVAKIDDSATEALIGLTKCRMKIDSKDAVKEQVEFLLDVYNVEPIADLLLLKAEFENDSTSRNKFIMNAIELKFKAITGITFGYRFLQSLDTYFILEALKLLPYSVKCNKFKIDAFRKLVDYLPGLTEAWILLANVYLESQDDRNAEEILRRVIQELNDHDARAGLMLAKVLIQQKKINEAESTLDNCLSRNLNIRSKPLFHFLQGRIHKLRNHFEECIESLEEALKCVSEKEGLQMLDLAALYLDLSSSYQIIRQFDKATDSIQKATQLLQGTAQEDQIVMARVDLELWKNDVNKALSLLSAIPSESPIYLEARNKIADIHLKHNKDARKFIECFKELAERYPTQENLIKLADAYFSIRKINDAVDIYEKAIKRKPSPQLSKKLAELYSKCHQYDKAMRCYREAGAEGGLDLAQLLFSLEQWEMAEITLNHVPLQEKAILLAKVKEKLGDIPAAISILNEAYKKIHTANATLAMQICCQMAEYEASLHNFESAIRHYKLASSHCNDNSSAENMTIQIALSKLYLQVNDWGSCQNICSSLLSKDENNELALLMSADLSFRKCDFFTASNLFHKLLTQKPNYWLALARMIEVKRRMASLKEVLTYLEKAAELDRSDPGLTYCTGLYNWYNGDLSEALKFFTCVKHDPEWGQQALHNMVEIYLASNDYETAETLLQEIHPNSPEEETNRSLLVNFVFLASRDKPLIDKAMNDLTLLASRDVLRVGASLGLAMGYMLQKQPQRARNVLKIIAKTAWQFEEAEYLERCWLMLGDHYVQSGKFELAYELVKKILTYNQGCSKAHELLGVIAEKDQKYGDAASHYVKAWKLSSQSDPVLGYRLGTYFIKVKKYAEAIATCQTVFKTTPNHSKLRKEIYEKAVSLLRT